MEKSEIFYMYFAYSTNSQFKFIKSIKREIDQLIKL